MGSPNGGIIGVINPTSFGKCTQTVTTSSGPLTTQPGTRLVAYAVVAGGGGAANGSSPEGAGGGGAGGLRTCASFSVCGATPYSITIGGGGTAGGAGCSGSPSIFSTITSTGGGYGNRGSSATGGAGGSGIVIVKELNKASGSWPLRAQFSSQKQGTWPRFLLEFDYLVVAGGGGGGSFNTGRWRWSRRLSYFISWRNKNFIISRILPNNSRRWRNRLVLQVQLDVGTPGTSSIFSTITSTGGGGWRMLGY
jgi:hypothetical protein